MTIADVLRDLDAVDEMSTIYAAEPWTAGSQVLIEPEPPEEVDSVPMVVQHLGLKYTYFLEVFVAREFLDGWIGNLATEPTLEDKCERLIRYAITDA